MAIIDHDNDSQDLTSSLQKQISGAFATEVESFKIELRKERDSPKNVRPALCPGAMPGGVLEAETFGSQGRCFGALMSYLRAGEKGNGPNRSYSYSNSK